ncbi:hypothetical protein GCM10020229_67780 [Kitasatospora albolonga]
MLLQSTLATATGPRTEYRLYDLGREDAPTCWRLTAPQAPVPGVSGVSAVPHGDLRPRPDAVLTH